ncbi:MAG TPA: polysaccharide deacetylase family protein [bacterium]|nr:polysaccharide deacetylase family protein [bacterium]
MSLKKLIKLLISQILYYAGVVFLVEKVASAKGVIILAYHRVNEGAEDPLNMTISPRDFEIQMKYLAAHYSPITMSDLWDRPNGKGPAGVVVSFDDGYADNYHRAFPILQRYAVPAIFFLTVEPIENRTSLWYDRICQSIFSCQGEPLDLSTFGLADKVAVDERQKTKTAKALVLYAKKNLDRPQIDALIHYLQRHCPSGDACRSEMLTWDQVREMADAGMEFGAHTMTHAILSRLDPEEQRWEIQQSKEKIEHRLGRPVYFFSYPNGGPCDYTDQTVSLLEAVGFRAACTLTPGNADASRPYALPRIGIDEAYTGYHSIGTKAVFACELAGIFDLFLRKRRRLCTAELKLVRKNNSGQRSIG